MPRGDKSKYTTKQKRKAEHIEQGYRDRGLSEKEAERRAWATVNATDHGGNKPGGSGRGKASNKEPAAKAAKREAGRPHRDPRPHARRRPKKPPELANAERQRTKAVEAA
jgi:hypothetical protein